MADSKREAIRLDDKVRARHCLYHRRSNAHFPSATAATAAGQRYLIELNTLADHSSSLADVFLLFAPAIHELDPSARAGSVGPKAPPFHELFRFMVELYHLHDKYVPDSVKPTEEETTNHNDILGSTSFQYISPDDLSRQIRELNYQCRKHIKDQIGKDRSIFNVRKIKHALLNKFEKKILAITDTTIRALYIPPDFEKEGGAQPYLRRLLTTLMNIQFTRKTYQRTKLYNFINTYSELWKTEMPRGPAEKRLDLNRISIKRYTSNSQLSSTERGEVLMNLQNLVDLRKKDISYTDLDIETIKELGNELLKHKKKTNNYYPLLHPKHIIFNQLTLNVSLSYQPPLLAALGLLKMPASLEQTLAFAATPFPFDQFSAPCDLLPTAEDDQVGTGDEILYDLMYGMDSLLQQSDKKYKNLKVPIKGNLYMRDVKMERERASEAWRFLMTASYLLHGTEYYKKFVHPLYDYQRFKQFLSDQLKKSSKGMKQYVGKVMGKDFMNYLSRQKIQLCDGDELSLSIFDRFFGVKFDNSDISVTSRFSRVNSLLRSKKKLRNELIDILLKNKDQNKMHNIAKYLALLYLCLFESTFHILLIAHYFTISFDKGRELLSTVDDKVGLVEFADNEDEGTYLERAYQKIKDYQEDKENAKYEQQIKYLIKFYEQSYRDINVNREAFSQLRKKFKKIAFGEEREETEKALEELSREGRKLLRKFKAAVIEIIDHEFPYAPGMMFGIQVRKTIFVLSTQLKARLFMLYSLENYTRLQSLVLPLLGLEKEQKQGPDELIEVLQYGYQILQEEEERQGREQNIDIIK